MNKEFTNAEASVLQSVAERLAKGDINADEANKLLCTAARFAERVNAIHTDPDNN